MFLLFQVVQKYPYVSNNLNNWLTYNLFLLGGVGGHSGQYWSGLLPSSRKDSDKAPGEQGPVCTQVTAVRL